jgi:hypothetical protein
VEFRPDIQDGTADDGAASDGEGWGLVL